MDPPLRSSPPKQRRGSLPASPALNAFSAWAFRDEMGLPQASGNGELLPQRAQSTSGIPPAPLFLDTPSKRMRKKWSDDETNMLVAGCNAVRVMSLAFIDALPALTSLHSTASATGKQF